MWACLDSNQGPLPYQRSVTVFWGFPQFTNILQIAVFLDRSSSRHFRIFTRVAAHQREPPTILVVVASSPHESVPRAASFARMLLLLGLVRCIDRCSTSCLCGICGRLGRRLGTCCLRLAYSFSSEATSLREAT